MSTATATATETAEPVLVAEHVGKRFEGITALADVSVYLQPGELVALIGPNGAGKTTLFNCLSGVLRPELGNRPAQGPRHRRPRAASASPARSRPNVPAHRAVRQPDGA